MQFQLRPHQLAEALSLGPADLPANLAADLPADLKVLSLDCFDTLLWRQTHRPEDVFADLAPLGISAHQRRMAEATARRRAGDAGREEVSLEEIYAAFWPWATAAWRQAAIDVELAAEARHCFAFPPAMALIRNAAKRGLRVVIVSNTYLGEAQLRALIDGAVGREVAALIEGVFASSAFGVSKTAGLFEHVKAALGVAPGQIFHLGDNAAADCAAALAAGLRAAHLLQFDPETEQQLRLEATAASLLLGRARGETPLFQPHRALLSLGAAGAPAAERLGHGVIGPVLAAYADWLKREADGLGEKGPGGARVHLLFLMRDGFLPMRAYRALTDGAGAHTVAAAEISRFAAVASALTEPAAVMAYLQSARSPTDIRAQSRQLLLTEEELSALLGPDPDIHDRQRWLAAVLRPEVLATVTARARLARERLIQYVRATIDPAPGDTLVIADLGYNGTVQTAIEPALREAFGVEIAGRYLLLREEEPSGGDKAGMIDGRTCDDAALDTLGSCMSAMEEICATDRGAVLGYENGTPLHGETCVHPEQSALRDRVQAACLAYIREGRESGLPIADQPVADPDGGYAYAAAALLRLLYLPLPGELTVLAAFRHDVYLGPTGMTPLFAADRARAGLREWGLFYMRGADRPLLPAEIRGNGLPLSLTMLAQKRFGLDLELADFRDRAIRLPIMVADGQTVTTHEVEAHPTHDGYYQASIPLGASRYTIGLQFGRLYECVQLSSLLVWPAGRTPHAGPGRPATPLTATPLFDGAATGPGGLLMFAQSTGLVLIPPPASSRQGDMVLSVVFRPIAERS